MTNAEINQDPVQGEFFSREADLPGRFVRESIQNSLDARHRGQTVRMRFSFSGASGALPVSRAAHYLDRLERHVAAVVEAGGMSTGVDSSHEARDEESAAYDAMDCFSKPMTYLVVEDFGTKGLEGDIRANSGREKDNHFWGFFRSIGISPKGKNAAGSWGLGKWVFPDASIINAYLGVTQRVGEQTWLLMGTSLLKTHQLSRNGDKYRYYGFFTPHDDDRDEDWFPLPVVSDDDPDDFILTALDDFGLERIDAPGLSVIVPYPKGELTPAAIAREVLTQYFLPVVRGDLVVEIVHPEKGDRVIDAASIDAEVGRITESERDDESPESLLGAIELTRWAINRKQRTHIELPARHPADELGKRDDFDSIRERYERSERLAFQLTTDACARRDGRYIVTDFRLYLERADKLDKGHDYFMRGPLRIPHMDHIQKLKARALVLVGDDSKLGHMLRDAEGPAHESWDPHAQRLKDNWVGGVQRVQDVRRAAMYLLQRLVERPRERQLDALADLFPGDPSRIRRRPGGGREPPGPPPQRPTPLQVDSPAGAFVVRPAKGGENAKFSGTVWHVRFAYDTVRGNPFTVFEAGLRQGSPDFSLNADHGLELEFNGCEIESTGANSLRFVALAENFRLRISGFDERDVKVEVREESTALDMA